VRSASTSASAVSSSALTGSSSIGTLIGVSGIERIWLEANACDHFDAVP
jgi:hypothetical protein